MATIFRGPTYAQQQRKPPEAGSGWTVTPRLLTALTLLSAVPFKTADVFVTPQHPSHALSANSDTSHGIPKTLYADANKAFANPPHFTPVHKGVNGYLHPDTSQSVSKALYADASKAFANPPHKAPDRFWPVTDTSQSTSAALLASTFVQPPLVNPPGYASPRFFWQPADASRGIPKTLYADAVTPTLNSPGYLSPRLFWQPADASASTAKVLYADGVSPFVNLPQPQVRPLRSHADTSQGVAQALAFVQAPFVNPPQVQVAALRVLADTSQSAFQALTFAPAAPFAQYEWPAPVEFRTSFVAKWDWQTYPENIPPAVPVVPPVVDAGYAGPSGGIIRQPGKKKKKREEELETAQEIAQEIAQSPEPISALQKLRAIKPKSRLKATDKAVVEAAQRIQIVVDQIEAEDEEAIILRIIAELL